MKRSKTAKDKMADWTPKRKKDEYCSPACGAGCTWKDYQKAKKDAASLAAQLGPCWEPVVWENLGWHAKASTPEIDVYIHSTKSYWATTTGPYPQFHQTGTTPQKAVKAVLDALQEAILNLASVARSTKQALKDTKFSGT